MYLSQKNLGRGPWAATDWWLAFQPTPELELRPPPPPPAPQTKEELTKPGVWTPEVMHRRHAEVWDIWRTTPPKVRQREPQLPLGLIAIGVAVAAWLVLR